jgi:hypothetical protein
MNRGAVKVATVLFAALVVLLRCGDPAGTGAEVCTTHLGSLVVVGHSIHQSDPIGRSGNTGNTGCPSIPSTFRNTDANPSGLQRWQAYTALPLVR